MSKHIFKIEIELDSEKSYGHSAVRLYLDDNVLGLVQSVNFSANVKDFYPTFNITYPSIDTFEYGLKNSNSLYQPALDQLFLLRQLGVAASHQGGGLIISDNGVKLVLPDNVDINNISFYDNGTDESQED